MTAAAPEDSAPSDFARLLRDVASLEGIFSAWDEDYKNATEAYRRAIDALHREAFKRLIRTLSVDPAARAALRQAVADEVVYAVLRHHELIRPSVSERIETALQAIRPLLESHGGDVELVKVDLPRVEVRFSGTCSGCAASALTFHAGVKKAVQDACPEAIEIVDASGSTRATHAGLVSPFASARASN